jgi:hypothetical protein
MQIFLVSDVGTTSQALQIRRTCARARRLQRVMRTGFERLPRREPFKSEQCARHASNVTFCSCRTTVAIYADALLEGNPVERQLGHMVPLVRHV